MSRTTANKLLVAPSAAAALTVSSSATPWLAGSWVEFIASTATAIAVAGISANNIAGFPNIDIEVDIGIGAAASEVVIGTVRMWTGSQSLRSGHANLFAVPIDTVPAGSRVSMRLRAPVAGVAPSNLALLYYASLTSGHLTTVLQATVPSAATGATVTPSGVAWTDSAYVQLTSGIGTDIAIVGLCAARGNSASDLDREYDLATGAAASETVITTLRAAHGTVLYGQPVTLWLPAPFPVTASTRIALRSRQSNTSTNTYTVSLVYLVNPALTPAGVTGTGTITAAAATISGTGTTTVPPVVGVTQIPVEVAEQTTAPLVTVTQVPVEAAASSDAVVVDVTQIALETIYTFSGTCGIPAPDVGVTFPVRRLRTFLLPTSPEGRWLFLRRLQILLQAGVGLTTGVGAQPYVMIQISRDGGQTWGPERWVTAGRIGEYDAQAFLVNCGRYRDGAVRLVVSDPVAWSFLSADADLMEGTS